jgi:hypothetical protein
MNDIDQKDVNTVFYICLGFLIIFVFAVLMADRSKQKIENKQLYIESVRDDYRNLDNKHNTLNHLITLRLRSLENLKNRELNLINSMKEMHLAYSPEGYERHISSMKSYERKPSFESYMESLWFRYMDANKDVKILSSQIIDLDNEIQRMQQEYENELRLATLAKNKMRQIHAYELNPNLNPYDMVDVNYFIYRWWALIGLVSFMSLWKMSAAFRYVVLSIGAVAGVSYLKRKKNINV